MVRAIAILYASLFFGAFGWAETLEQNIAYSNFQEAAKSIPQALQRLHYSRFGLIDLEVLQKYIPSEAEVEPVSEVDHKEYQLGDLEFARNYAEWSVNDFGKSHLKLNEEVWKSNEKKAIKQIIGLHETLGFYGAHHGVTDDNYQISMPMWTLWQLQEQMLKKFHSGISKQIRNQLELFGEQVAGGVYGGGGGGDGDDIENQVQLIRAYIHAFVSGDSDKRSVAFHKILLALSIKYEVSEGGQSSSGQHMIVPAEIDLDFKMVPSCRQLIRSKSFESVWSTLAPNVQKVFESEQGLENNCYDLFPESRPQ